MPFIYPQSREDYFFRQFNEKQYEEQIEKLTSPGAVLGFSEKNGFIHLSIISKIMEIIKGALGFKNCTDSPRLNAERLKFLYYGENRGFLTEERMEKLRVSFNKDDSTHPSILKLFKKIENQHKNPSPKRLAHMRAVLIEYHNKNSGFLRPGFLTRIFHKPYIDSEELKHFGDVPLQMAQREESKKNVRKALNNYLRVYNIHNTDPEFQRKFGWKFKEFTKTNASHPLLIEKKPLIHQILLELADKAYNNTHSEYALDYLNCILQTSPTEEIKNQIGKLYLVNQVYDPVRPLLTSLQSRFSDQASIQEQIGDAHWHYQDYVNGIAVKEKAAQIYLDQSITDPTHQTQAAGLYSQIGQAYLDKLEGLPINHQPAQAIIYLEKAIVNDPKKADYQKQLNLAYIQQWQEDPQTFFEQYGSKWLSFLDQDRLSIFRSQSVRVERMVLEMSKQLFEANRKDEAIHLLNKAIPLFENGEEFVLETLNLCTDNQTLTTAEGHLNHWTLIHDSNPFIQKRIGELIWDDKKQQALVLYHRAIELFKQKRQECGSNERQVYDLHLSDMHAKIGQDLLQREPTNSVPYDEAIAYLEEAAALNPSHKQSLHLAYLAAAGEEKKKDQLTQRWEKILNYYSKAFSLISQNAFYLTDLMNYYLSHDHEEAVRLFIAISQKPWSNQFLLTSEQFNKLAKLLQNKGQKDLALYCFKTAYELNPNF